MRRTDWSINFMITADGYSKDPGLLPEGIVITWGKDMIEEKGGPLAFIRYFNKVMSEEGCLWLQKCRNRPQYDDLTYVYIIILNRLAYRGFYGGYETGEVQINDVGGGSWSSRLTVSWPRIILGGPIERCPFKRTLRGFQGFRYCTKLF